MQDKPSFWQQKSYSFRVPRWLVILLALITLGVVVFVAQRASQPSTWDLYGKYIRSARFSPDNRVIATAPLLSSNVILWDVSDGRLRDILGEYSLDQDTPLLEFSKDGNYFSWSNEDFAFFYEVSTDRMVFLPIKAESSIYALAMSPGNVETIATGGGSIELWDYHATYGDRKYAHLTVADLSDKGSVYALAFSDDGKLLAAGTGDGSVYMWQVDSRQFSSEGSQNWFKTKQIFAASTRMGGIRQLALSPDNQILAAADENGKIAFLSMQDGKLLRQVTEPGPITRLLFSPDSKLLAVSYHGISPGNDERPRQQPDTINTWRVSDGMQVWASELGPEWIANMKFSPNGKDLTVSYYNRSIRTYTLP
jgi:WD40 repeat protein